VIGELEPHVTPFVVSAHVQQSSALN
jgi:hypothetical protein